MDLNNQRFLWQYSIRKSYMDIENKTMSRKPHELIAGYCYHITVRCNNREFRLTRLECRKVLLFTIKN